MGKLVRNGLIIFFAIVLVRIFFFSVDIKVSLTTSPPPLLIPLTFLNLSQTEPLPIFWSTLISVDPFFFLKNARTRWRGLVD